MILLDFIKKNFEVSELKLDIKEANNVFLFFDREYITITILDYSNWKKPNNGIRWNFYKIERKTNKFNHMLWQSTKDF